ncbi:MAG: hypothetical protein J6P02_02570 [Lachnospiraceae bacterium]|nr:hypothetical protein [Lachnospiraceae bacterium]
MLLPYELIGNVRENDEIIINDTNGKMYDLPKQVCDNSSYIYEVHKGSVVYNSINIRLDDIKFEKHNITLFTSRTHYFDSLISNRACDLVLKDRRSIREIFELGPYIKPLNLSKMSNHIGFNGLVITSDGYILLIKRSRDVSVAKGILATSILASLKTKYAIDKNSFDFTLYGLANSIRHEVYDELNIDLCNISDDDLINGIKFFYRYLIERGKP